MNRTTILLLTFSLMLYSSANGINSNATPLDEEVDIIFVSIDKDLRSQLTSLASYALSTYTNHDEGRITIKVFASDEDDKALVKELVVLIHDLGIDKTHIKVIFSKEENAAPFFSMSIYSLKDLGHSIGYHY